MLPAETLLCILKQDWTWHLMIELRVNTLSILKRAMRLDTQSYWQHMSAAKHSNHFWPVQIHNLWFLIWINLIVGMIWHFHTHKKSIVLPARGRREVSGPVGLWEELRWPAQTADPAAEESPRLTSQPPQRSLGSVQDTTPPRYTLQNSTTLAIGQED